MKYENAKKINKMKGQSRPSLNYLDIKLLMYYF